MRGPWRSVHHVEVATLAWVDWWNTRILSPIGGIPPAEFEAEWLAASRNRPTGSPGRPADDQPGIKTPAESGPLDVAGTK